MAGGFAAVVLLLLISIGCHVHYCEGQLSPGGTSSHLSAFPATPNRLAVCGIANGTIVVSTLLSSNHTVESRLFKPNDPTFEGVPFIIDTAFDVPVRNLRCGRRPGANDLFEVWYEVLYTSGQLSAADPVGVQYYVDGTPHTTIANISNYDSPPDALFDFFWNSGTTLIRLLDTKTGVTLIRSGMAQVQLGNNVPNYAYQGRLEDLDSSLVAVFTLGSGADSNVHFATFQDNAPNPGSSQFPMDVSAGAQLNPDATRIAGTTGSFVGVWQDINVDGDGFGIRARAYGVDLGGGFFVSEYFLVNTLMAGDQVNPRGVSFGNQFFAVVWETKNSVSGTNGLSLQLFTQEDTPLKVCEELQVEGPQFSGFFDVSAFSPTGFVLAWKKQDQVHGKLFDTAPELRGPLTYSLDQADSYQFSVEPSALFPCESLILTFDLPTAIESFTVGGVNTTQTTFDGTAEEITQLLEFPFTVYTTSNFYGTFTIGVTLGAINPDIPFLASQYNLLFNIYVQPILQANQLAITDGGSIVITQSNLFVLDLDTGYTALIFTVTDVYAGQFLLQNVASTSFSMQDILLDRVSFTHTTPGVAPTIQISVTDGRTVIGPSPTTVTYILDSTTTTTSSPSSTTTTLTSSTSTTTSSSAEDTTVTGDALDSSGLPAQGSNLVALAIGFTGGALCLCAFAAVGFFVWRKRSKAESKGDQDPELKTMEMGDANRVDKGYTVIGHKWELITRIKNTDAQLLEEMTGVVIPFESGKVKAKVSLGQGQFGKLRLAREIHGQQFAGVKKVKGEKNIALSMNESAIQKKVEGMDNVMPLLDSFQSTGHDGLPVLYTFMPLAGFGNGDTLAAALTRLPPSDKQLKDRVLIHIAQGLLNGVVNLHSRQVYHLDLKPSNFVIDQYGTPMIIDFGCGVESSTSILDRTISTNGDTRYFSPERFAFFRSTAVTDPENGNEGVEIEHSFDARKADDWAAGLTLLECALNCYPLAKASMKQKLAEWSKESIQKSLARLSVLSDPPSDSFYAVLVQLLQVDPKLRATAKEALDMDAFKSATALTKEELKRTFFQLKELAQQIEIKKSSTTKEDKTAPNPWLYSVWI